ncbi:hypothetical protein [Pseudolactococcus reticulitermitis]|uniref:Uncharacterized protein n=1 Tax=Pseudolactococcus reticulitermitis TaxID=2025039 RepID=A0A224WYT0_9LACT|nr:hypothetical protein [Lactococcus reticulitermitis]GAX47269.1 hypothetical protein RsY01_868 [Lactococcus reticulitermitis]
MTNNFIKTINIDELLDNIPVIDHDVNYWFVRTNGGDYFTDFNINSYIGIDYNEITLEHISDSNNSTEILKNKINHIYYDQIKSEKINQTGKIATQLLRFVNRIEINDIIIIPSISSELFLVGRVISNAYEIPDSEIITTSKENIHYKKSSYKKRINVKWIKSFSRDDADSKLYKMIFSHQVISDVNDYKIFINRALFPVYIEDDTLHIVFKVTKNDDINGASLGQFIYYYNLMYGYLFPGEKMEVKVNVQSPGPVETISKTALKGMFTFALLAYITSTPYGGKVTFGSQLLGNIEVDIPGLVKGYREDQTKKIEIKNKELELDDQKLKQIEKAIDLADKLKVPITELGIELPDTLSSYIEEKKKEAEKTDSDTKQQIGNESSINIDSNEKKQEDNSSNDAKK